MNAESELFASVELVEDWFATYRYLPVLSVSEYTGFAVNGRFGTGPPVTGFSEHAVAVPIVKGNICPVEFGAPASVTNMLLPPVRIEVGRVALIVISEFVV